MKIEILESDSFEDVKSLFREIFMNEPWNDDWSDDNQLTEYILDLTANRNSLAFGLYDDGEFVGFSLGSIMHWCSGTEYYIYEFAVKKKHQHKGLGTFFLHEIEEYVKGIGVNHIYLQTDNDMPAYSFYQKNGFTVLDKHLSLVKMFDRNDEVNNQRRLKGV